MPEQPLVLAYRGRLPRVHPDAWLAPGAAVIGDVEIGSGSSVWFGSVVRGDFHYIRIGERTNLQDQCVVHVTRERFPAVLGDEMPRGGRRLGLNTFMLVAVIAATIGAGWSIWGRTQTIPGTDIMVRWVGVAMVAAFVGLALVVWGVRRTASAS